MQLPDKAIVDFIEKHHIFTLATVSNNAPYACTCFYKYLKDSNLFVFTSDYGTRHVNEMINNNIVAGTIALETKIIGKIQGLQFTGKTYELQNEMYETANKAYLLRFPFAGFKKLMLWVLEPCFIKMTHNKLGFGNKLIWEKK